MLWYVHQNKDFDNLINIKKGLQEKKTKLGTQHMSKYLADVLRSKNGKIELNVIAKRIEQKPSGCIITDSSNKVYECDYLVIACSPWQANKIDFFPQLSMDRKLLCERSFMGSYVKVILLYKRAYWKERGLSG
jgi:monoamine oxidase